MSNTFALVPIQAAADDRLSKTELRLLIALLSFADKDGKCYPKREKLAEITGLALCKISSATSRLVALGWLEKTGNGGRSAPSHYRVKTVTESVTVTESETVTESVTKTVTDSVTRKEQTNEQTKKEKNTKKEKSALPAQWQHLPDDIRSQVSESLVGEFVLHRKAIRKPITLFGLTSAMRSAVATAQQGITETADQAVAIAIEAAWQGINPEWIKNRLEKSHANSRPAGKQSAADRNRDLWQYLDDIATGRTAAQADQPPVPEIRPDVRQFLDKPDTDPATRGCVDGRVVPIFGRYCA